MKRTTKLNNWCKTQRTQRRSLKDGELQEDRKKLLDKKDFIWDVPKYRFEKKLGQLLNIIKKMVNILRRIQKILK